MAIEEDTRTLAAMMPRLLRRARRYAPSHEAAEDLAQEALMRVWARLSQEPQIEDIERYLFASLRNLARRQPRPMNAICEKDVPQTPPDGDARLMAAEVLDALNALPDNQAAVLRDLALDGQSYAEIARRRGLPLGTVMSRAARGRARLRARMGVVSSRPVAELLAAVS
jgi:RNA polymerase sigma-70 factor (ECF subfamily)